MSEPEPAMSNEAISREQWLEHQYLDLLPNGRNEDELDFTMVLVQRHDEYS